MKISEFHWSESEGVFFIICRFTDFPSAGGDLCMASISLLRDMPAVLFQLLCEEALKV